MKDKKKETDLRALLTDLKTDLTPITIGVKCLLSGKLDDKPELREKYLRIMEAKVDKIMADLRASDVE